MQMNKIGTRPQAMALGNKIGVSKINDTGSFLRGNIRNAINENQRAAAQNTYRGFKAIDQAEAIKKPKGLLNLSQQFADSNNAQNLNQNRINYSDAYGSSSFIQNPDGSTTRQTSLNPEEQKILDMERSREGQIGSTVGNSLRQASANFENPLDLSSLGERYGAEGFGGDRSRIESTLVDSYKRKMDPIFQQQSERLQAELNSRGLQPGTEQYDREMKNLRDTQNESYLNAASSAAEFGGNEQQRMFGMSQDSRAQGLEEMLTQRGMPLQEARGLLGLSRGVGQTDKANVTPINYQGINPSEILAPFINNRLDKGMANLDYRNTRALADQAGDIESRHIAEQGIVNKGLRGKNPNSLVQALSGLAQGAGQFGGSYLADYLTK